MQNSRLHNELDFVYLAFLGLLVRLSSCEKKNTFRNLPNCYANVDKSNFRCKFNISAYLWYVSASYLCFVMSTNLFESKNRR